ncbi:MAG TPA: gamma-glutamylcyclotransferase family protein [Actinophytocola sp.]|nr:gamma-glutamylcyclotransferase family protein [Actinophytocola sp.]
MTFADADYPAVPYPGARPPCSFVHVDGTGQPLTPDRAALSGWRTDGRDLDDWLAARGAAPLAERVPLLCYGSNACPAKLTWLRDTLGLTGPAVLLRARCTGLAAVWAAGLRVVDDQRPATLAAVPGEEVHAVWLATPDQLAVLDRCEGRGNRYRLAHVTTGEVRLEDGTLVERPLAYVANERPDGARTNRHPLLVDGRPVRCADVPQAAVAALAGEPATGDGLAVLVVDGVPVPADLPPRLFVYGTLRPGASHWHLIAPHVTGEPRRTRLPGTLYDTGFGYPALRLAAASGVPGWLVELAAPAAILSTVDEYEGAGFRRVRVTVDGGTQAWTYVWTGPVDGMRPLPSPWANR